MKKSRAHVYHKKKHVPVFFIAVYLSQLHFRGRNGLKMYVHLY